MAFRKNLDAKSESFKFQYEKFLIACDALEDGGEWNKLAHGEMDTYYFNDLMCAVLKLISADGRFTDEEADYVLSLIHI